MEPEVSVVVPTHNRPDGLAALLAALREQTLAAERFEVIVVDDDCVPTAGWIEALLDAAGGDEAVVVQGPVAPSPEQRAAVRPLSHTIQVQGPDRLLATCNIAYARALLDRLGGFDESYRRSAE